jgi:hypothetical protein
VLGLYVSVAARLSVAVPAVEAVSLSCGLADSVAGLPVPRWLRWWLRWWLRFVLSVGSCGLVRLWLSQPVCSGVLLDVVVAVSLRCPAGLAVLLLFAENG